MKKLSSVWLNELSWLEVRQCLKKENMIILPIGSTEEHGPGAPLGLDSYVAIALSEDAAKKTNILITPPLWYGDSSHHLGFPGTISLRPETLISIIKDIGRSLAKAGFKKILIINGHKKANLPSISIAAKELHEDELPEVLFAIIDPMYIAKGIAGKIKESTEHHAGELEISHLMYKYPKLINKEKLPNKAIPFAKIFSPFSQEDLFGKAGEVIEIPWNSQEQKAFAPNGSFSNSSQASVIKGKQYHDYMVKVIVDFINWLKKYKGPIGNLKRAN